MNINDTDDRHDIVRVKALLPDQFVQAAAATIDSTVLGCHDRFQRSLVLDVPGKSWQLWDNDDHLSQVVSCPVPLRCMSHLEFCPIFGSSQNSLQEGRCNLILHLTSGLSRRDTIIEISVSRCPSLRNTHKN
jgi:hypothetical protein